MNGIARSEIQRTLDAVIASDKLGQGERRSSLLDYLVTEEVQGRGDRISAYSIAMDVFGRGAEFDPKTDSIVRTEIGRLRTGLMLFFADAEADGLVRIEFPKGSYRPVFSLPPAAPAVANPSRRRSWLAAAVALVVVLVATGLAVLGSRPTPHLLAPGKVPDPPFDVVRVAIRPFTATGNNPNRDRLAFGLYSEVSADLSIYPWLTIVRPIEDADLHEPIDYVLSGEIMWQDDNLQTRFSLVSLPEEELIWSSDLNIAAEANAIEEAEAQVASQVVQRLASFHGIAPELVKSRVARQSQASLDAYLCIMAIAILIDEPTDELHRQSRNCLEQVTRDHPTYGMAFAALAYIYLEEVHNGRNLRPGADPWADATRALETALTHAPLELLTLNVALIHSIEGPDRDLKAFIKHATRILELFPRHPDSLANIGSRLSLYGGDWEVGLALLDQAIVLQTHDPSWYFLPAALHALETGDEAALEQLLPRLTSLETKPELIVHFIADSRAGREDSAAAWLSALADQGLSGREAILEYIHTRSFAPELSAALIDGIDEAFAAIQPD